MGLYCRGPFFLLFCIHSFSRWVLDLKGVKLTAGKDRHQQEMARAAAEAQAKGERKSGCHFLLVNA